MLFATNSIILGLVALAAAAPTVDLESRQIPGIVSCPVKDTDKGGQVNTNYFDYAFVQNTLAKQAPAGNVATKSGYPHQYLNFDMLTWSGSNAIQTCTSPKLADPNSGLQLLEFPVAGKGSPKGPNPPLYDYTQKGIRPGPCRMVYTNIGGAFCGIMCHSEYSVANPGSETDKGFILCT